ncbi:MAG: hypothetical protein QW035_03615 [Candidatus Anstonellales archaeon]
MKGSSRSFKLVGKSTALLNSQLTKEVALEIARNEQIKEVVVSQTNLKRASLPVLRALRKVGITIRTKPSFRKRILKRVSLSLNKSKSLRSAGLSKSFFYRK